MRPFHKLLFLPVIIVVFLFSCIREDTHRGPIHSIKIRESAEPASINPFFIRDEVGYYIAGQIFQPFLAIDYKTNELVGVLVKDRPKISSNQKWEMIMDYELRENVSFSNNEELNINDILYSIKAQVCPVLNPNYSSYYQFIDSVSVNAEDSSRFTIYSKESHFLSEFSSGDYYILSEKQFDPHRVLRKYSIAELKKIQQAEEDSAIAQYAKFIEALTFKERSKPIGSGAYTLENWKSGEGIQLKKKRDWWAEKLEANTYFQANANQLDFYFLEDATVSINALKNGEFDLMRAIPAKDFNTLTKDEAFMRSFDLKTAEKFGYQYLGFNLRNHNLSSLNLRKAIAFSLPRSMIIEKLYYGLADEIISLDKKETKRELIAYQLNEDSVKYYYSLFKNANSTEKIELNYAYNAGNDNRKAIGLILKEALKEINIELNIEQYEWSVYLQKLKAGEFDLFFNGTVTSSFTPDLRNTFHSSAIQGGRNYFGYQDSIADQLLEQIAVEFDQGKREALYDELKFRINRQLPMLVILRPFELMAFSKELKNANAYQLRPNYWAAEMSK